MKNNDFALCAHLAAGYIECSHNEQQVLVTPPRALVPSKSDTDFNSGSWPVRLSLAFVGLGDILLLW